MNMKTAFRFVAQFVPAKENDGERSCWCVVDNEMDDAIWGETKEAAGHAGMFLCFDTKKEAAVVARRLNKYGRLESYNVLVFKDANGKWMGCLMPCPSREYFGADDDGKAMCKTRKEVLTILAKDDRPLKNISNKVFGELYV